MRIFILNFISIIILYGQTTHNVTTCQLRKVIKNGWNDSNETLNTAIILLGEIQIPKIVKKLDTPLIVDTNTSNIDKIPKLNLSRAEYIKLFAYSKYLEKVKNERDVLSFYIRSVQGLHDTNDSSIISIIYKIALNDIIIKSLNKSIDDDFFTSDSKQLLKDKLSSSLILDNTIILDTVEHERKVFLYYAKQITLEKSPSLFNKKLYTYFIKYYLSSGDKMYDAIIKAIQTNTLDEKEKIIKKKLAKHRTLRKRFSMWVLETKLKFYNFLSLKNDTEDYKKLAHYMVDDLVLIETPALSQTYKDYINMVESNKKILQRLNNK